MPLPVPAEGFNKLLKHIVKKSYPECTTLQTHAGLGYTNRRLWA